MRFASAAGVVTLIAALADGATAQLANRGFEDHVNGRPAGWYAMGSGFEVVVDSVTPLAGRYSLRTRWTDPVVWSAAARPLRYAIATQHFSAGNAAGRRIRITGYIRTSLVQAGFAGFWMGANDLGGRQINNATMPITEGAYGTTPWTRYEMDAAVDPRAATVVIGMIHPGDGTAWFDSVSVQVVGDSTPRTTFKSDPRPAEDLTRLLSDAELALPRDMIDVPEDSAYTAWMKANARPIRSLGATNFADLRFFAPLLANKRIVQLGESGHGVAEFNMAKVRLVKYLHEELGYDVMAFESSTYECERAHKNVASLTALELMRACIFGVWHADETLPLFEYIKQTQNTPRPLILAGVDEQPSSGSVRARSGVFRSAVAVMDTAYARRVFEVDSAFLANRSPTYASANRDRLVAFYDSLAAFLRTHRRAIEAAHPSDRNIAVITRQAAVSMTVFVRQLAAGQNNVGTELRDRGMADNLDFLLDELYPGKKVIVWAHNFHIQHRENTRQNAADTTNRQSRTMGVWVAERHRKELYTIGLFMYRGTAAGNTRRPYPISQAQSGSLESIVHRAPWRYSFVDFSQARRSRGSEWMWTHLNGFSWGTEIERFVPRDEYDGVLFIDKVHAPTYR